MRFGLVADSVGSVMGERPDVPAGTDPTPVEFVIEQGAGSKEITDDLVARELVTDRLAFAWVLASEGSYDELRVRSPHARPDDDAAPGCDGSDRRADDRHERQCPLRCARACGSSRSSPTSRRCRSTNLDIEEFYALATDPTAETRDKFGWMDVIPEGHSVEGFLGAGVFDVPPDIDAEGMLDILLQRWQDSPSFALINEPQSNGLSFYETVILASIVEREAILDEDRPLIAGVYQNRVNGARRRPRPERRAGRDLRQGHDAAARPAHHASGRSTCSGPSTGSARRRTSRSRPTSRATRSGTRAACRRGRSPRPASPRSRQRSIPTRRTAISTSWPRAMASNGHVFAHTYEEHLRNIAHYMGGGSPEPEPETTPETTEEPTPDRHDADSRAISRAGPTPIELARPARLDALRRRMEAEGVDAYFGVRRENTRYLTGFELGEGEEKVAGQLGPVLRRRDESSSSPTRATPSRRVEQCAGARVERVYNDLVTRWPELLSSLGSRQARRRRGRFREPGDVAAAGRRRARRGAGAGRGLGRAAATGQGAVRDRAHRCRLRSRRRGAERLLPSIKPGTTEARARA